MNDTYPFDHIFTVQPSGGSTVLIVVVERKGLCGFTMIDVTKKVPNARK